MRQRLVLLLILALTPLCPVTHPAFAQQGGPDDSVGDSYGPPGSRNEAPVDFSVSPADAQAPLTQQVPQEKRDDIQGNDKQKISGGNRTGCGRVMIENNQVDEAFAAAQHKAMADIVNEAITGLIEKDHNRLYADYLQRHNEILKPPFPFLQDINMFMKKNWGPGVEVRVNASWDTEDLVKFLKDNGLDLEAATAQDAGTGPVERPSPFSPKDPNDVLFGTGPGCGDPFLVPDGHPNR